VLGQNSGSDGGRMGAAFAVGSTEQSNPVI
jgi:hypothetical protein